MGNGAKCFFFFFEKGICPFSSSNHIWFAQPSLDFQGGFSKKKKKDLVFSIQTRSDIFFIKYSFAITKPNLKKKKIMKTLLLLLLFFGKKKKKNTIFCFYKNIYDIFLIKIISFVWLKIDLWMLTKSLILDPRRNLAIECLQI